MADLPTQLPSVQTSSRFEEDSIQVELLEEKIQVLEVRLAEVQHAAGIDLQNLQADLIAKNRRIGQLERELADYAEDTPEAEDAKGLLVLWRDVHRKGRKNVDITLASDRGRTMLRVLKAKDKERVRRSILGAVHDDWAMGRTSKQDRPYNDIAKHILKDSDRFEHFEQLYLKHNPEVAPRTPASPQLALVHDATADRSPLEVVLQALPFAFNDNGPDGYFTRCPACTTRDDCMSIREVGGEFGVMVLLDCYAGCGRDEIIEALGLGGSDVVQTRAVLNEYPAPIRLPEHLREAMQQLLARGVVEELA